MRIVTVKLLLLGLALAGLTSPLGACCGDDTIAFPGIAHSAVVRGDYLLCVNDANHIVVVDMKRARSFDLGKAENRRWNQGDVANGQALLLSRDKLQVIELQGAKMVHEVTLGADPVYAFGFTGKGRAFVHRGKTVAILELATGKTLHTIELGPDPDFRRPRFGTPWQKVGNRLFVPGPATTLCVIDLDSGKLHERYAVEARAGIFDMLVEGSQVYCLGSHGFSWAVHVDHMICFDMERKKSSLCNLPGEIFGIGRFASGPYGTAYLIDGNQINRFTMSGERCATFTVPGKAPVLGIWQHRAVTAAKGEIRLIDIDEKFVTQK